MRVLRVMDVQRSQGFLAAHSDLGNSTDYPMYTSSGSRIAMPIGPAINPENDPFSTQLPPTERVFFLLGAYFVVVVPLNFLVLKKLKRGELAWVTAPLISLGFAGAFFFSAKDLYSAKMSTATAGILVAQEGIDEGMFIGKSQIFIPQGGNYDLKMDAIDSLGIESPYDNYSYSNEEQDTSEFNPVDDGEVKIANMQANNLAFRSISYRQKVAAGRWLSVTTQPDGPGIRKCIIRNASPYDLENGQVYVGEHAYSLDKLPSGGERSVVISDNEPASPPPTGNYAGTIMQFTNRNRAIAVTGKLVGFRPGPQLGAQVEGRTSVGLAFFAKEALGPK